MEIFNSNMQCNTHLKENNRQFPKILIHKLLSSIGQITELKTKSQFQNPLQGSLVTSIQTMR